MSTPGRVATGASLLVLAVAGILYFRPGPPPEPASAAAYPAPATQLPVASVTDGDTFRVLAADGSSHSVRVLGIDAAELHPAASAQSGAPENHGPQCYATEARAAVSAMLAGTSVQLSPDPEQPSPDRYGRELAYVRTQDGTDLAESLLSGGFVRVYNAYPVSRTTHYLQVQADARARGAGGWKACGWTETGR